MSHIRLAILIVSLVIPVVAHAADGGVHVYLQPLPPEGARLSFAIASVSAVAANGVEFPLKLNLRIVSAASAGRQRLLSFGALPAGSYTGFTLRVKDALVRGERGGAALVVPDAPVGIRFPFSIAPQRSAVVWLTLMYDESLPGGVELNPVFLAVTPPRPIAEHAGFVTNSRSNTITVFDKSITQAVAVIETCGRPAGMALDRTRRRLYVACSEDDEIQSIDVTTNEVLERARMSPGDRPRELALTPDGVTLIVVNSGSESVSLFDALSLTRKDRIAVGNGPQSLVVEPSGRRALVFNTFSSSVSIVDLLNKTLTGTVSTESAPIRGLLNRRGDRLFVIYERSPYMVVMDPRELTVISRARLPVGVTAVAVDPVRGLVCIGGESDAVVDFYDPTALLPLYSMKTPGGVSFLGVDVVDNTLYLVNRDTRSVAVARLADRKIFSEIDVGDDPYWVAVMGER